MTEEGVKDVCTGILQLVYAALQDPSWYVVWSGDLSEKALLTLRTQLQFLVSGCWCQPLCSPGVGDLKTGIEAIEVIWE